LEAVVDVFEESLGNIDARALGPSHEMELESEHQEVSNGEATVETAGTWVDPCGETLKGGSWIVLYKEPRKDTCMRGEYGHTRNAAMEVGTKP
jgi:hypothetical protein